MQGLYRINAKEKANRSIETYCLFLFIGFFLVPIFIFRILLAENPIHTFPVHTFPYLGLIFPVFSGDVPCICFPLFGTDFSSVFW